jgi:hypothetical protein
VSGNLPASRAWDRVGRRTPCPISRKADLPRDAAEDLAVARCMILDSGRTADADPADGA